MNLIKSIKENISQIIAVAERYVKQATRHKFQLFLGYFMQMAGIILPLIVMGRIFTFAEDGFGFWNRRNFVIYQFTAVQIMLIYSLVNRFQSSIAGEKNSNSISLLILAPFRKTNLLFGIFVSHLVLISLPFMALFIICYILSPVSIITLFFVFIVYMMMALCFSGIGLALGGIIITKQHLIQFIHIPLMFLIMFSCLSLPFEFFPGYYQNFAVINPFYYVMNIVRFVWVEDNIILSITSHATTFLIVIILAVVSPLVGVRFFNYMYYKYGITIY